MKAYSLYILFYFNYLLAEPDPALLDFEYCPIYYLFIYYSYS